MNARTQAYHGVNPFQGVSVSPPDQEVAAAQQQARAQTTSGYKIPAIQQAGTQGTSKASGGYNARTQSVAAHTQRLLDQDSSYMQQARTQGLAAGNRRGLLNSSMSAQAGEASARDAVMPIATQDSAQDYGYGMQQSDHRHQASQLSRQLSSQAALQRQQLEHQAGMQGNQFAHNAEMQGNQFGHERFVTQGNWNLQQQAQVSQHLTTNNSHTAQIISNIMNNPNMSAQDRQNAINSIHQWGNSNNNLVEQIYGINFSWDDVPSTGTTSPPGTPGGGSQTPPPKDGPGIHNRFPTTPHPWR